MKIIRYSNYRLSIAIFYWKISVNYFNYEKNIKFDVKYNSDENHVFVSIINIRKMVYLSR